jgi:hypothetical protein
MGIISIKSAHHAINLVFLTGKYTIMHTPNMSKEMSSIVY